eukprot:CAMPEP_0184496210 /NCGR_PEP_ID=MMETSP0113_2-20130426/33358_1 /TAXON_ID=91329 /ORGANISM="Norrisiella sphaerica, Strain BC52" /LENGTH=170 /DNA_ID=CAMNT_0026882731 /DNA_START=36 /DNA_END=545 /DNA_ORIENTATION=-
MTLRQKNALVASAGEKQTLLWFISLANIVEPLLQRSQKHIRMYTDRRRSLNKYIYNDYVDLVVKPLIKDIWPSEEEQEPETQKTSQQIKEALARVKGAASSADPPPLFEHQEEDPERRKKFERQQQVLFDNRPTAAQRVALSALNVGDGGSAEGTAKRNRRSGKVADEIK